MRTSCSPCPCVHARPGFTLIEIVVAMVMGLLLCVLALQLSNVLSRTSDSVADVELQYETIREMERIVSEYRHEIQEDDLDLDSLLSHWAPDGGVDIANETVSVSSTDGSLSFSGVRKVRLSKGGQSITAYFTE